MDVEGYGRCLMQGTNLGSWGKQKNISEVRRCIGRDSNLESRLFDLSYHLGKGKHRNVQ